MFHVDELILFPVEGLSYALRKGARVAMPLEPAIRRPAAILPRLPRPCMLSFTRRAAFLLPFLTASAVWGATEDAANTVVMTLKNGKVVIRLRPDWAPKHVAQVETL